MKTAPRLGFVNRLMNGKQNIELQPAKTYRINELKFCNLRTVYHNSSTSIFRLLIFILKTSELLKQILKILVSQQASIYKLCVRKYWSSIFKRTN